MTTEINDGQVLARRIETGWAALGAASAEAFGTQRQGSVVATTRLAGGFAVRYGTGDALAEMLSQAQGMGFDGPVTDADLDRLMAFYGESGGRHTVEVATLADPGVLTSLAARGYRPMESTHVLFRPLGPADTDPGFLRRAVTVTSGDGENAAACAEVVLRGFFEGPGEPPEGLADVMEAMTAAPGSSRWLARVGGGGPADLSGEPAGGACLFCLEGLAFFAGDATLPAFRRLGVQGALIRARLAEAARLGCEITAVCTQPGSVSQRNYERAGFRLHHARVLMAHGF